MKKVILLFFVLFLICGCNVEYELNIEDSIQHTYSENIKLISETKEESNHVQQNVWPTPLFYDAPVTSEIPEKIPGVAYYTKQKFQNKNYFDLYLTGNFNAYEFNKASSVRKCYQSFYKVYDKNLGITNLRTSSEFLCYEKYPIISEVTIRVTISNPVVENNADKVNGNIYEWYINRNNYKNKPLVLTYEGGFTEAPKNPEAPVVKKDNSTNFFMALIVIGLFIIFIIGAIILNVKKKNQIGR